jgi:hypothetical protein
MGLRLSTKSEVQSNTCGSSCTPRQFEADPQTFLETASKKSSMSKIYKSSSSGEQNDSKDTQAIPSICHICLILA